MGKKKIVLRIFLVFVCLVGLVGIARYFFPIYHNPTRSMAPTIPRNSFIWLSKISYITGNPKRFDLVVFHPPETSSSDRDQSWVRRVYGLPGEKIEIEIEIDEGRIEIDGVVITIPEDLTYKEDDALRKPFPWITKLKLGDYEHFLMGDNFDYSRDSREFGAIKRNDIFAKVIKIMPPSDL